MVGLFKKLFSASRNNIKSAGKTDTGRVRSHNEDTYCILSDRALFAVADGMGGHNAGEVASRAAVQYLDNFFTKEAVRKIKGKKEAIQHLLIKGFHYVNNSVIEMAQEDPSRSGMGVSLGPVRIMATRTWIYFTSNT